MTDAPPGRPDFTPGNWPGWCLAGIAWALGHLPRPLGRALVWPLGPALRLAMVSRRRIAERNIAACFPEHPEAERRRILKQSFASLARMVAEMAWCWARPPEKLHGMVELSGHHHILEAVASGRGVLVVTAHFTCLEMGAMALGSVVSGRGVYRPLRSEVMEWYQNRGRRHYAEAMISKRDLRSVVRFLRDGGGLWYAPDQDFGPRQSAFAPFFGIRTATLLATHRLPKLTGCLVVTMFPYWDRESRRYRVEISPPIQDFPGEEPEADLARINALLEAQVRRAPEQYWWIHRRFKTRPPGEPPFYTAGSGSAGVG